jgi:hypothetical protein
MEIRMGEVISFHVEPSDTLGDLKTKSEEFHGVPVSQQLLIFAGAPMLDDNITLEEYKLKPQSKVFLVMKLRGGCNNADGVCTCKT